MYSVINFFSLLIMEFADKELNSMIPQY